MHSFNLSRSNGVPAPSSVHRPPDRKFSGGRRPLATGHAAGARPWSADEQIDVLGRELKRRQAEVEHRMAEIELAHLETVRRLGVAAEYRDDDTGDHVARVAQTVRAMAENLDVPEDEIKLLTAAAPLHDVGKIAIPDNVLLKPGRLTDEEMDLMRGHAQVGAKILSDSPSSVIRVAEEIAMTHHERWDGTGYPRGLQATQIPLCGRLVAVADVYDALTHERPYKEAWPIPRAVDEIASCSGSHFDPRMVDAFMALDHRLLVTAPTLL